MYIQQLTYWHRRFLEPSVSGHSQPGGHFVHVAVFPKEYWPVGHEFAESGDELGQLYPFGQAIHSEESLDAYVPISIKKNKKKW